MNINEVLNNENIGKSFQDDHLQIIWTVVKNNKILRLATCIGKSDEHYIEDDYFEHWLPTIKFKFIN